MRKGVSQTLGPNVSELKVRRLGGPLSVKSGTFSYPSESDPLAESHRSSGTSLESTEFYRVCYDEMDQPFVYPLGDRTTQVYYFLMVTLTKQKVTEVNSSTKPTTCVGVS